MKLPVAPELFDVLIQYAKDMKGGKIKLKPSLGSTSPAVTFCENFYLQFFQNRLKKEIHQFNREAKEAAIRLRLQLKDEGGAPTVILLITWYERLCEIYPNILSLGYGVGSTVVFLEFHNEYLPTLLERTSKWAADEKHPNIEQKAQEALKALRLGLESIEK